jgi:hypothetical protein
MRTKQKAMSAVASVLAVYLVACTDPQALQDMQGQMNEIQAQQKDLLVKMDELAKGQKEILAKAAAPAAAAKPAPPAEDPNKVWDIPVGNSFAKGSDTATVTIVEWSDFQ